MATLAFLGTGNMGFAMAGRLIDAGHEVRVYNRTSDKAAPMAERGAMVAAAPKDAAAGAEGCERTVTRHARHHPHGAYAPQETAGRIEGETGKQSESKRLRHW